MNDIKNVIINVICLLDIILESKLTRGSASHSTTHQSSILQQELLLLTPEFGLLLSHIGVVLRDEADLRLRIGQLSILRSKSKSVNLVLTSGSRFLTSTSLLSLGLALTLSSRRGSCLGCSLIIIRGDRLEDWTTKCIVSRYLALIRSSLPWCVMVWRD